MSREKLAALKAVVLNVWFYLAFGILFAFLAQAFLEPALLPVSVLLKEIGAGAIVVCLVIMARQSYSMTLAGMGIKYSAMWQDVFFGLLVGGTLSLVGGLMSDTIKSIIPDWGRAPHQYVARYIASSGIQGVVLFSIFVFTTPLIEEVFFRGIIYSVLRRAFSIPASLLLSSGIFGLLHVYPESAVVTFLLGCGLALLREWRKSLVGPIIAHVTVNCLALISSGSSLA